jgi:hypothetical protein
MAPEPDALVEAQISIGRLETEVAHLTRSLIELKTGYAAMDVKLEEIQHLLAEANGGWRTVMWLGGAAASIGGFVSWATTHLTWR